MTTHISAKTATTNFSLPRHYELRVRLRRKRVDGGVTSVIIAIGDLKTYTFEGKEAAADRCGNIYADDEASVTATLAERCTILPALSVDLKLPLLKVPAIVTPDMRNHL